METQEIDLRQTLRVLWRRKLIIALSLVLVTGGALFTSLRQTPQFSASATVVIRPVVAPLSVGGNSGGAAGPLGLELSTESEAEIMKSATIASRVKEELGLPTSTDKILKRIDVDVVTDEVLRITASSPSRTQAAEMADAFAKEYVANRRDLASQRLEGVAADLRQRLDAMNVRVGELDAQIVALSSGTDAATRKAEVNRLTAERDGLLYQIGALRGRYEDVRSTEASTGGGDVVQAATVPRSPSSPKPIRDGAVGGFLGSLMGVGLALLRERLDDRIRTGSDAARVAGIPVIGTLPRVDRPSEVLASFENPHSPGAEGHRALRQSLAAMGLGKELRTILISSEDVAAGKTTIVANLGAACALSGMRTILVSGDMRRPTLHHYFDVPNGNGLSTILGNSKRSIRGALVRTELPTLRVMPSGPMPQRPAALLDGVRLGEVLEELRAEADVVIIDSPPLAAGADSLVFAAQADLTLLVVRHDVAKAAGTQATVAAFARAGAGNTAMVLNAAENDPDASYYGYYSTDYSAAVLSEVVTEHVKPSVTRSARPGRPRKSEKVRSESEGLPPPMIEQSAALREEFTSSFSQGEPEGTSAAQADLVGVEPFEELPVGVDFAQGEPLGQNDLVQEEPTEESVTMSTAESDLNPRNPRPRGRVRGTVMQAQEDPLALMGTDRP